MFITESSETFLNVSQTSNTTCQVTYNCPNCTLLGNMPYLTINFDENLYAAVIGWTFYVNYPYENVILTDMSGTVPASNGNVFKVNIIIFMKIYFILIEFYIFVYFLIFLITGIISNTIGFHNHSC